ncbi:glycosyltransferase [candidate division KSB1 bacterium]|nr:glycosyltransferase [candidate division KSB1 bacterium]
MLFLLLSLLYAAGLIFILAGLEKPNCSYNTRQPQVSIVVAARNEAKYIGELLTALLRQDYPRHLYDIIIVDDQSTDGTETVLNIAEKKNPQRLAVYRTSNRNFISPKKQAIALGIEKAKGEIILLTDADCVPPPGWITQMMRWFSPQTGMVIGFSPYENPQLRKVSHYMQALDSLALAALSAATTGWKMPATCSGRNLAYRKKVFTQLNGFKSIEMFASGDDDLFLQQVKGKTKWNIQYAYDPRAAVPTCFIDSFKRFYHQRLRHASKGFHYSITKTALLVLLYLYNVLLLFTLPWMLLTGHVLLPALALAVKAIAEFMLLFVFAFHMKRLHFLKYFPVAFLLHIPYVVIFAALGQFKKFEWKTN